MRKSKISKAVSFITATTMAVLSPFAGIAANAADETVILKQADIDEAVNNPGVKTKKGLILTNEHYESYYEMVLDPGKYELGEDISVNYYTYADDYLAVYSGDVTINLNKYKLCNTEVFAENEGTSLTINGDGYIEDEVYSSKGAAITLNGGEYDGCVNAYSGSSIVIIDGVFNGEIEAANKSSITINDGTFIDEVYSFYSASLTINGGDYSNDVSTEEGSELTINGGTFNKYVGARCEGEQKVSSLTINGGTFKEEVEGDGSCDLTVTGGTFETQLYATSCASVIVSGGTFNGGNTGLSAYACGELKISGGTFNGCNTGLSVYRPENVTLSGGTFTATGIKPKDDGIAQAGAGDVPKTGIIFFSDDENTAKNVFDDVLAQGYEYSPEITPDYSYTDAGSSKVYYTYTDKASFSVVKHGDDKGDDDGKGDGDDDDKDKKKYSNEWVDGKWYNADGTQTYKYTMSWKQNATGWWIEDTSGWFPASQWQKIDGKWYYFCADGYMDYSEYREGCWLGADGAWVETYSGGHWMSNSTGWWYEDASGWYPQSQWLWIDGSCYYFGSDGYMATSTYIDGCWVGADGAWVK